MPQQLLEIWRKAKGKERDALLWGDEVCRTLIIQAKILSLTIVQIEYLVVSFDDQNRQVKLSLRQAGILEALANDAELIKQRGGVAAQKQGIPK